MVKASAKKKGEAPRKTSWTDISGRTLATTKQLRPIGGVIKQSSAIFTTMMPNQMAQPADPALCGFEQRLGQPGIIGEIAD